MMVTDLYHFLDLPEDTPGPARRLAQHLDNIVRAATAGDASIPWISALPCRPASPTVPCDEPPPHTRRERTNSAFANLNG